MRDQELQRGFCSKRSVSVEVDNISNKFRIYFDVTKKLHRFFLQIPSRELTYPPDKAYLKMIFLFPRWDMLISWRVIYLGMQLNILLRSSNISILRYIDPIVLEVDS